MHYACSWLKALKGSAMQRADPTAALSSFVGLLGSQRPVCGKECLGQGIELCVEPLLVIKLSLSAACKVSHPLDSEAAEHRVHRKTSTLGIDASEILPSQTKAKTKRHVTATADACRRVRVAAGGSGHVPIQPPLQPNPGVVAHRS